MFENVMFYVVWGVVALLPLISAAIFPPTVKKKVIACLCVLIVTFGFTVLKYMNNESIYNRWNNGVCNCGGVYELSAVSQFKCSKSFYYTCDSCGHTEEFSHLMKQVVDKIYILWYNTITKREGELKNEKDFRKEPRYLHSKLFRT